MARPPMRRTRRVLNVILIILAVWICVVIALAVHIDSVGRIDNAQESETIIVLGAGLLRGGRAGPAMIRRVERGAALWQQGYAQNIICTGGYTEHHPRSEAEACREILLNAGVPYDAIYMEETSTSTEENAMYSREIMDVQGWETALVVSDAYHIFRADWLFHKAGIEAVFSPVPPEEITGRPSYNYQIMRELLALHWQAFKDLLGLPFTSFPPA